MSVRIAIRQKVKTLALTTVAITAAQVFGVDMALAQAGGGAGGAFAPIEAAMQMIVDFVTGPFGRLAAIIAVIALGFMAFAGRLSWIMAFAVLLGIGLVFGGTTIVDELISTVS